MKPIGPHLISIEDLDREQVEHILDTAQQFTEVSERAIKKVPTLRGKTVVNLFLEPSTRTRTSFEIAAKRLSADAVNIGAKESSVAKGETLMDTALTIQAMAPDILVMRHPASGAHYFLTQHLKNTAIVNAGDGLHEHPTQALLDALTIRQAVGKLERLTITLVGDSLRSRVTRSDLLLFKLFNCKVRGVAPPTLLPAEFAALGLEVYHDMPRALEGADVVISMRTKFEYLENTYLPSQHDFARRYCITEDLLSRYAPNCVVLAPGPYVRGIEVSSEVIDGPRSQYERGVTNGVATRMAVLFLLAAGQRKDPLGEEQN